MDPSIHNYQKLVYKGKVIFSKMVLSKYKRFEKYFQEIEACFMFIDDGNILLRIPDKTLHFKSGDGLSAKCGNYFFESNYRKNIQER